MTWSLGTKKKNSRHKVPSSIFYNGTTQTIKTPIPRFQNDFQLFQQTFLQRLHIQTTTNLADYSKIHNSNSHIWLLASSIFSLNQHTSLEIKMPRVFKQSKAMRAILRVSRAIQYQHFIPGSQKTSEPWKHLHLNRHITAKEIAIIDAGPAKFDNTPAGIQGKKVYDDIMKIVEARKVAFHKRFGLEVPKRNTFPVDHTRI
jgi:hypothetical protein